MTDEAYDKSAWPKGWDAGRLVAEHEALRSQVNETSREIKLHGWRFKKMDEAKAKRDEKIAKWLERSGLFLLGAVGTFMIFLALTR